MPLSSSALALRTALATTPRSGRGNSYPVSLRLRVVEHTRSRRAEGDSLSTIASSLGLSPVTVQRWLRHAPPAASAFLPVTVLPALPPSGPSADGLVRLPNGICIEGLSLAHIVSLCRSLST